MTQEETGVARRLGVLLLALAGAVVLFLGLVGGGVALFLYWHGNHQQSFERRQAAVVRHYAREFHACVRQQKGTRAWCSDQTYQHCATDSFWETQYGGIGAVSAITQYCDEADG